MDKPEEAAAKTDAKTDAKPDAAKDSKMAPVKK
jgi:hypothetical protein